MQHNNLTISPYSEQYRQEILNVWESAVLATHDFLTPTDFEEIKELVAKINFNEFKVFCLTNQNSVFGFIGVAAKKVEMLFLDPKYFGQGMGRELLTFAVDKLNADKVDVNEQNTKAIKFYQKFGFETFERTDKDDQGRDYPLLRMKLVAVSSTFLSS
jgi:putative acetyltransferase